MKKSKRLTLSDIAREAKVSKMTVSRAINNDPTINANTRERVLEVVKRLNYEPNLHARALATNRSFLIGVIIPDLMHSYFAEILHGIELIGHQSGYEILFASSEENLTKELSKIEAMRKRTDGLIIASALSSEKTTFYKELIESGMNLVLIDRPLRGLKCPLVTTDNVKVGMIAAEHLLKIGYRRIGHLSGTNSLMCRQRMEGYRKALQQNDITIDESLIRSCGLMETDGYQTMSLWIREGNLPEAVYAVNDPVAIGAMQAITDAGLKVGKDIGVMGSGAVHYGDMLGVPLTTVSWSRVEIGQLSASILIQMIEKKEELKKQKLILEPELIVRSSCGSNSKK